MACCPGDGCTKTAAEHAALTDDAPQLHLPRTSHAFRWAFDRNTKGRHYVSTYRCELCNEEREVPVGTRGTTLRAYLGGECKGVML